MIVVQFIYQSKNSGGSKCLEPKGCPRKGLFLSQGSNQNSKVQFAKFQFKNHSVFCQIKLEDSGHDKKSKKLQ